MARKFFITLIILGLILLLICGLFTFRNLREAAQAEASSQSVMESIHGILTAPTETAAPSQPPPSSLPETEPVPQESTEPAPMTEKNIGGQNYIGYLTIDSLGLELPVLSQWSYQGLRMAPCRQCGTLDGNDLVIAAHNYPQHFGNLHSLPLGASIRFTDMNGITTDFSVGTVEKVEPNAEDYVLNSSWDLVLYTCTVGGEMRVMAGADRS